MTSLDFGIIFQIPALTIPESGLSEFGDSRMLERKGRLRRLKESRLHLPSTENDLRF